MITRPRCRVCGDALPLQPVLTYCNMPAAAQFMPKQADLATERGADLAVSQCLSCGLVQLVGKPVRYYREVVRAAAVSADMRAFRLDQFRSFAARHGLSGRKVLEVGCGGGDYLAALRDAGMDACGLEHAARSVEICRANGLPAYRGFIDGPRRAVSGAPYAAFFILNFLEHLPRPRQTLLGIAANLEPAAVGMVEVPNFDMIVRDGLFSEFVADHLLYFTEATLRQTLSLSGFDVLECAPVWHDYILSATVRKRDAVELSHLETHRHAIGRDVAAFFDRFKPQQVAIWGAGHQALALISLLSLQDRVRYVVDAAPFKQNCFTPASHLPIVAPSTLRDEPVEAVLVMAGSYSSEVAAVLRRDYAPALHVAVLGHGGLRFV